jgi:transcriptional regulator with XRE-family HTH domain
MSSIKLNNIFTLLFAKINIIIKVIFMTFGQRLRDLRLSKDLTQKQFGLKIGVAESTVSLYEAEKRVPDKTTLYLIADFFEVSLDYLLGRDGAKYSSEITAASSDTEYKDWTPEMLEELERAKEFIRFKFGKK